MFELTPFGRRNDIRNFGNFDPWHDMARFEREFWGDNDKAFKTDIKDEGDHYLLEAELPGFEKEDIKVNVEDGYLTISAERKNETEEKKENGYIRRERRFGSFSRSFDVTSVNTDSITAEYKNGVLALNLPKKDETKPAMTNIEIK